MEGFAHGEDPEDHRDKIEPIFEIERTERIAGLPEQGMEADR